MTFNTSAVLLSTFANIKKMDKIVLKVGIGYKMSTIFFSCDLKFTRWFTSIDARVVK